MNLVEELAEALADLRDRHLKELGRLVEIPSVSAQGTGIAECAEAVAELLETRGLATEIHTEGGNPVVVASGGHPDGPVLLFYEHYDVQPPEPLEEWSVPPFAVTERDGNLYGRGVADTKGNLLCRLAAVDAVREVFGEDTIGYRFLVEGEEEIGSPTLDAFIERHADELRADGCLWEFGGVDSDGHPVVSMGLKGIITLELHARGPRLDAHSSLGAVLPNPLYRLAAAIASLRDADGRVTVDGFYDDVDELTPAELAALGAEPDPAPALLANFGPTELAGGAGPDVVRRLECEPVVNVNGIHGGYVGPGSKTVLPSTGFAKLDVRLVPSQRPERIVDLLRSHLDAHGFADVDLRVSSMEAAGRTPLDDPFAALVIDCARRAYEAEPIVQVSSAGTGPAHPFRQHLRVPFASAGCNYPGSRIHAPDEHVRIRDFELGKLHSALVTAEMRRP